MPVKYIPFEPNTVEGEAVLNNITRSQRILRYRESDKVFDRIQRGMPYYEVETTETIGKPSENLIIRGECISACAYLKEKGIKVDLVYIDPPFASGVDYAKKVFIRKNPHLAEKIAKAEKELEFEELRSFEEKMYGDIWQKEDYLNWMYENLRAIKTVMSDDASIYLHLDWNIVHYAKVLMDEVFSGYEFSEIIWACGLMGAGSVYPKSHETILFYKKENSFFQPPARIGYGEYVVNSLAKDEKGWFYTRRQESSGGKNSLKTYISENPKLTKEEALEDARKNRPQPAWSTWLGKDEAAKAFNNDFGVGTYAFLTDENVNYTTQKPQSLLERIIKASSKKGMVVADFFGGSGVTAKTSHDLERTYIHCDIGINSIQTVRDRLKEAGGNFNVVEIKDGITLFRNPQQTMDKLASLIPGLQKGLKGLNDFWFGAITKSKEGIIPVYIPNLLNSREKVLDIPQINRIINQELQSLEISVKKIVVYYIDIEDKKQLEKFIKDNNSTDVEIQLLDLKNLLNDVVVEDTFEIKSSKDKEGYKLEVLRFVSDRLTQKINDFNQKGNLQSINKNKPFSPIDISESGLELIELIALDCENSEGKWTSFSEIKIDKLGFVIKNGARTKDFWDGTITCSHKPLRIKIRNICGDETVQAIKTK